LSTETQQWWPSSATRGVESGSMRATAMVASSVPFRGRWRESGNFRDRVKEEINFGNKIGPPVNLLGRLSGKFSG
jgi:hypothetical protein